MEDQQLDTQVQLYNCKRTVEELKLRVDELERALEQLTKDYNDLALVACSPR